MSVNFFVVTRSLAAGAAVFAAITTAPGAAADPPADDCQNNGVAVVCESTGSGGIYVEPPDNGSNAIPGFGNGPYGPAGGQPPVGSGGD